MPAAEIAAGGLGGIQRGQQPVDADGHAGRRHRLPGEAFHEVIVPTTARDRAELARTALFVGDLEGEFGLEDRAGVIAEATNDGWVDDDAVSAVTLHIEKRGNLFEFPNALLTNFRFTNCVCKIVERD